MGGRGEGEEGRRGGSRQEEREEGEEEREEGRKGREEALLSELRSARGGIVFDAAGGLESGGYCFLE